MGRYGVKKFSSAAKTLKKSFPKMRKVKNIAIFLVILWNREAVATKKFIFSLFGGIKIDFREGNRVLGGQPMGIFPVPFPFPMCACLSVSLFVRI